MYLKIKRRNRPDCIVMLCPNRATKKWCFVNLSTEYVCTCRFDTIDDAFADLRKRAEVASFSVIDNPFAPHLTENAMPTHVSSMPNCVEIFRENEKSALLLLWAREVEEE